MLMDLRVTGYTYLIDYQNIYSRNKRGKYAQIEKEEEY
jgi:hypothetical protein